MMHLLICCASQTIVVYIFCKEYTTITASQIRTVVYVSLIEYSQNCSAEISDSFKIRNLFETMHKREQRIDSHLLDLNFIENVYKVNIKVCYTTWRHHIFAIE